MDTIEKLKLYHFFLVTVNQFLQTKDLKYNAIIVFPSLTRYNHAIKLGKRYTSLNSAYPPDIKVQSNLAIRDTQGLFSEVFLFLRSISMY